MELPEFSFGLWGECPKDVEVAWGARGIADPGVGFSLLPDRQTWVGDEKLRKLFSKMLNEGPLRKANEKCKRLRHGWKPAQDLDAEGFLEYWEDCKADPSLLKIMQATGYLQNPTRLFIHLQDEREELEQFYIEDQKRADEYERNPPPPPPPPAECEYDADDDDEAESCGLKFKRLPNGDYDGCYVDCDSWICENCGWSHPFEEDVDWPEAPETPIHDMLDRIVGYQMPQMRSDKPNVFTLYDDDRVTIKGDTRGSYGYVYLIAYPKPGWQNGLSVDERD